MEMNSYEELKQHISRTISKPELERLKNHFSSEISSKRSLAKIGTGNDLFHLLETRDLLSKDNTTFLGSFLTVIDNKEVKKLIRTYEKLEGITSGACICAPVSQRPMTQSATTERNYKNDAHVVSPGCCGPPDESLEFSTVIMRLSQNVGEHWPILLRELGLTERCIEEVRERVKDPKEQAALALQMWQEDAGPLATTAKLKEALSNRLCKRRGMSPELLYLSRISCY